MLKYSTVLLLLTFLYCSLAAEEPIPIISKEIVVEHDGKFHYSYESGDGTKVQEHGELKVLDKNHQAESVEGSYEFSAPDGQKIAIQYTADENGYQPVGDSIPVAPPVPEAISRALKFIAEHPEPEELPTPKKVPGVATAALGK